MTIHGKAGTADANRYIAARTGLALAAAVGFGLAAAAPAGAAGEVDRYLDLPLVNRDAAGSPVA